jgi:transposase
LLGQAEPILTAGGRAMGDDTEIFVGIDVAKVRNAIAIADGERGGEVRFLGEVDSSEESMRRVVKRIAAKYRCVQFCYEAGPTGYGLHRLITSLGHNCIVVAPSLVPRRPGDQVKTNRRDAISLAKLLRAGELTAVWVPDEGHEAMRDLVRGRAAAVEALRVHRQVSAFMLKHGRVFPRKKGWTMRYLRWLQEQQFDHPAHQIVLQEMVEAVRLSKERVERLEQTIEEFVPNWSLAPVVRALQALRGIDLIVSVTFVTEIGDVRRFETSAHGLSRLGTQRTLDRSDGSSWWHHEGREWTCPSHAGRERLDVSPPAPDRNEEALSPTAGHPSGARNRLEGADASHGSLSHAEWARQEDNGGLHSNCTRACWLHVVGRT